MYGKSTRKEEKQQREKNEAVKMGEIVERGENPELRGALCQKKRCEEPDRSADAFVCTQLGPLTPTIEEKRKTNSEILLEEERPSRRPRNYVCSRGEHLDQMPDKETQAAMLRTPEKKKTIKKLSSPPKIKHSYSKSKKFRTSVERPRACRNLLKELDSASGDCPTNQNRGCVEDFLTDVFSFNNASTSSCC